MRYTTLTDLKTNLGITGSSTDAYLTMEIKHGEARLDSMLSVRRLDIHLVEDERHDARGAKNICLQDLHVVEIGEILDDTTVYTQDDEYDIDNYVLHLEGSLSGGRRNGHIDYAAGYNAAGIAKLTVTDYAAITATMTLDVNVGGSDANVLTEGTEWNAATSNNATATSIADAINLMAATGQTAATGVRAFALEAVVYIVDEMPGRITSTVTASLLNGLTLISGGGTAGAITVALTMDGVDFPEDLIEALYLMIGAKLSKRTSGGVKSYKIGSKSVTFGSASETNTEIKTLTKPYKRAKFDVV